ncbi:hypothetical protein F5Y18DRAFT_269229 [Xylariaceae sp. FL1019]|nr:hypothetical protein F5Y18DRAFT_269229 [Xylariaceae sp. FL1019]
MATPPLVEGMSKLLLCIINLFTIIFRRKTLKRHCRLLAYGLPSVASLIHKPVVNALKWGTTRCDALSWSGVSLLIRNPNSREVAVGYLIAVLQVVSTRCLIIHRLSTDYLVEVKHIQPLALNNIIIKTLWAKLHVGEDLYPLEECFKFYSTYAPIYNTRQGFLPM